MATQDYIRNIIINPRAWEDIEAWYYNLPEGAKKRFALMVFNLLRWPLGMSPAGIMNRAPDQP